MPKAHNKKRNVGIVYEQLLRFISRAIVQNDIDKIRKGTTIIKKHFRPGTELYREFRLFTALVKTEASSEIVAKTILSEARQMAKKSDSRELDREKSMLIRSINHSLDDKGFYHQRVPEYRTYATIQTLLNDWRSEDSSNIARLAEFESKIHGWLLQEKKIPDLDDLGKSDSDSLVVKIMTEKLNGKFGQELSSEQKEIIRLYTLMTSEADKNSLVENLMDIKERVLEELDAYLEATGNQVLNEKADRVRKDIVNVSLDNINDETISRFLTISQLRTEILSEER